MDYEKPILITSEQEYFEGVYAASGDVSSTKSGCDSIYINGVWHKSDYSDWAKGTNINGRGCEGCPANWNDGKCHAANYEASEDLRPSWEKQGKGPNDKWNE